MSQQVDNNTVTTFLKKQIVVKSWIEEVLNVKLGDDLIAALKNGIVLCYLMMEIEPLAIPSIQVWLLPPSHFPHSAHTTTPHPPHTHHLLIHTIFSVLQEATTVEFRLKENISFFLDACQELGMAKYERFQPNELWNPIPNSVRVVECIFCLSKIAAQRDFSPSIKYPFLQNDNISTLSYNHY